MKRWISFLVCVSLLLSLTACVSENNYATSDEGHQNSNSTTRTKTTTLTNNTNDDEVRYISDRDVQYSNPDKRYTIFFGLKNADKVLIDASGTANIIIYDDEGEKELYSASISFDSTDFTTWSNASWDSDRYLCGLYLDRSVLSCQESQYGILALKVTLSDGTWFDYEKMDIYSLPTHEWEDATCTAPKTCSKCGATKGSAEGHNYGYGDDGKCRDCGKTNPIIADCSLSLPSLPKTINYYDYDDDIISSVSVTKITYTFGCTSDGYITLSVFFSGKKLYDHRGAGQSDECRIGWKLYDDDNNVLDTGTFYSPSVAEGEGFVNKEEDLIYSFDNVEPGSFRLEIMNVN